MRRLRKLPVVAIAVALVACGSPDPSGADSEFDVGTGGGGTASTDGGAETGKVAAMPAAGGIAVEWIEANQGVGVEIGRDGQATNAADRTAYLISNRPTLVRAFWTIPDDWQPREIRGELHLSYPDGTTEILTDKKQVDAPSFIGRLDTSFSWGIVPERATPGVRYRVELFETDAIDTESSEGAGSPNFPADDRSFQIGFEDSYQVLKVVVVPFNYNNGTDCVAKPDTSKTTMQRFRDMLFQANPVERVDFTLHEPVEWDTPLEGFSPLNMHMLGLRGDEEAAPETYYYGLINVCAGNLGGYGGLANGIPTDPTAASSAYQRISSGLSLQPDWSADTLIHEVGHSQGRRHVACSGEEAGADPTYPIPGGELGEWGFGVIDFQLRHPSVSKDYMTYCHPAWVSTWGWNKIYPVIRALSALETSDAAPSDPYGGSLLVGTRMTNGEEIWQTVPGRLDRPTDADLRFEFRSPDRALVAVDGARLEMPYQDGPEMFAVPLPPDFDARTEVTRIDATVHVAIPPTKIQMRHHLRGVSR